MIRRIFCKNKAIFLFNQIKHKCLEGSDLYFTFQKRMGTSLYICYKSSIIKKIARGLYKLSAFEPDAHHDLILASFQAKHGIICLISALYFHEVTSEIPKVVDMAIPKGTWANKIIYPRSGIFYFNFVHFVFSE